MALARLNELQKFDKFFKPLYAEVKVEEMVSYDLYRSLKKAPIK